MGPIHSTISFPERADAPALKDINFLAEGERVIASPSGVGKSTVAAHLQCFYQPHSRSVSIGLDAIDIAQLVRHHISVISQNPTLFYGDESVSDVDI